MVYTGPSTGCRACRTRRVKCDGAKPSCHNCTRRGQICPGYADVFDGAHRNQNKVVLRRVEKQNARRDSTSPGSVATASPDASSGSSVASPAPNPPSSMAKLDGPLRWISYTPRRVAARSRVDASEPPDETPALPDTSSPADQPVPRLGPLVKPDATDASVNFFFRYYTDQVQTDGGFSGFWLPLYVQSAVDSPLRIATAAVTVNIAMMWCFQGCDRAPARQLFTQAVAATRKAIQDPSRSAMDELLMAILVFDLYDSLVLHYIPGQITDGKHTDGAMALIKHRGSANYQTETGRGLVRATRHALLQHALTRRRRVPPGAEAYFRHPALSQGWRVPTGAATCFHYPAVADAQQPQLDALFVSIADVQAELWTLRRHRPRLQDPSKRQAAFEQIVADALTLDGLIIAWKRSVAAFPWAPVYIPRDKVRPSIQHACFYGSRCAVWTGLAMAEMWNLYHTRRLILLQVIRQAFADAPGLLDRPQNRLILVTAEAAIQSLADATCETVPFYTGDTTVPTNPIYHKDVNFPTTSVSDPVTGKELCVPDLESGYATAAVASGGWMMYPHLLQIYRMVEPEDDAVPIALRPGQLDWIKGQVQRLQKILLFCDPVW